MIVDNRIIDLLIKKKLGNLSLTEHTELTGLLEKNGLGNDVSNLLDEFWELPMPYQQKSDADQSWDRVKGRIDLVVNTKEFKPKSHTWFKVVGIAASILIIIAASIFFNVARKDEPKQTNVVTTKRGSKSFVILPDGSKVWINNESKLVYAQSFDHKTREVTLEGEAFFDVVKDKNKPFIVHTKHADVHVLGTAFNVKAYNKEQITETTLLRGAVELVLKGKDSKKINLIPNQKLILNNNIINTRIAQQAKVIVLDIKKIKGDSLTNETQWINNKLTFDQEKLVDIVPVLERWYNVKIQVKIPQDDKKITGNFENRSITDVLDAIQFAGGFKYRIKNGNEITIYK